MISIALAPVFAPWRENVFLLLHKGKTISRKGAKAQSIARIILILRRPFDVIDDDDFHGAFC